MKRNKLLKEDELVGGEALRRGSRSTVFTFRKRNKTIFLEKKKSPKGVKRNIIYESGLR